MDIATGRRQTGGKRDREFAVKEKRDRKRAAKLDPATAPKDGDETVAIRAQTDSLQQLAGLNDELLVVAPKERADA